MVKNQNFVICILIILLSTYEWDDIFKDRAEDVKTRFDNSNHELDRPLPKGKHKKVTGLIKDELDGTFMTKTKSKKLQLLNR